MLTKKLMGGVSSKPLELFPSIWKLKVNTPRYNGYTPVTPAFFIPINLYRQDDVEVRVDWGDGTQSKLTSKNYDSEKDLSASYHEYAVAGEYEVTISCNDWNKIWLYINRSSVSYTDSYIGKQVWSFRNGLTEVMTPLPRVGGAFNPNTYPYHEDDTLEYLFYGCNKLTTLSNGLFSSNSQITCFDKVFLGCDIPNIPGDIFANCESALTFDSCFSNTNLTAIPEGLFDDCINANAFVDTFYRSKKIATIPAGLFDNCTRVTSFEGTFRECGAVTNIPDGLFDNCPLVETFYLCFNYYGGTTIPSGLFDSCVKVTNFNSVFFNSSRITAIPDGLFRYNTLATDFTKCFCQCSVLTTVPSDLFSTCTNANKFGSAFASCSAITSALPTLWISHPSASHMLCFYGCRAAPNYQDAEDAGWAKY